MAHTLVNSKSRVVYDSGVVASGAAFNTGVLDLSEIKNLIVVIANADAGTRTLRITLYAADGTTAILGPSNIRTVTAGGTDVLGIGPGSVATGITAIISYNVLPPFTKFDITAAGSSNCRLTIYGR